MVLLSVRIVNSNRERCMAPSRIAFWKHEAKLSILDTESGLKFILWVAAGITTVIVPFLIASNRGATSLKSSGVSMLCAIVIWPLALAADMYLKGGDVGHKLKSKCDDLQKLIDDRSALRLASTVFTETKQALRIIRNFGDTAIPKPTTEGDYGGRVMEFTLELRRRTVACLESCNEHTKVIQNAELEVDSIKPLINHIEIVRKIDDRLETIETIQKTL